MEARAREGTLTIMFGGDKEVLEAVRPLLDVIGNKLLHMGGVGSGQLTKLINQLLFNISCAAIAEVLPMAVKLGLDPEKVTGVVTTGTSRSFAAEFFAPLILDNRFDQGYPLEAAYKDMLSAAEISAQKKIPLPLVHAATTTYQMALAQGLGGQDKGAMIKVFERILGIEFRKQKERT
jgi:3-hydroxyisobutyrate dehydrogenase-like beta-hydroxyacid dehydrogenase